MTEPPEPPGSAVPGPEDPERPPIDRHMLEALVCPLTRATLEYDPVRQELISRPAHLAYPIRHGIPILLRIEAREID